MVEKSFFNILNKSEEGRAYLDLIYRAQSQVVVNQKSLYENHHIFPRCLGGSDDKSNLVKLTVRDHILAHYYLASVFSKSKKLLYAFGCMCQYHEVSEREFFESLEKWAKLRQQSFEALHASRKGKYLMHRGIEYTYVSLEDIQTYLNQGWSRGHSEETKLKISQANRGRVQTKKREPLSPEVRERIRLARLARGKIVRSEELKKRLSDVHTNLCLIHNCERQTWVRPEELQDRLAEGWILGGFPKSENFSQSILEVNEKKRKIAKSERFCSWWEKNKQQYRSIRKGVPVFLCELGETRESYIERYL